MGQGGSLGLSQKNSMRMQEVITPERKKTKEVVTLHKMSQKVCVIQWYARLWNKRRK